MTGLAGVWYNVSEAAEYLGISRQTFSAWVREGRIPAPDFRKNARILYWTRETLDAVKKREVK